MAESSRQTKTYGIKQTRKRKFDPEDEDKSGTRQSKKFIKVIDIEIPSNDDTTVIEDITVNNKKRQPLASVPMIDAISSDEYDCPSSLSSSVSSDFSPRTIKNAVATPLSNDWDIIGDQTPRARNIRNFEPTEIQICKYKRVPCCVTPSSEQRVCTLPKVNFAEPEEVWRLMCHQDERGSLQRDPNMLHMHKGLHPRMRAILLDWLIEVCEVYKMRRETYFLAVDYIDRYLTNVVDCVPKNHLQLIGVTCLFIAAKVEEIYPPKITEFAYITDGACSEDDILKQELAILSTLQWNVSPITVIGWVSLYMQINVTTNLQVSSTTTTTAANELSGRNRRKSLADQIIAESVKAEAFIYPQFSAMQYTQVAQLVDLCSLDVDMANYQYSVIAAAAISHIFDRKTSAKLSGFNWDIIAPCARWLKPYYEVLKAESGPIFVLEQNEQVNIASGLSHLCPNIQTDESHTIQTHAISIQLFDSALKRKQELEAEEVNLQWIHEESPGPSTSEETLECLLTPPASNPPQMAHSTNCNGNITTHTA